MADKLLMFASLLIVVNSRVATTWWQSTSKSTQIDKTGKIMVALVEAMEAGSELIIEQWCFISMLGSENVYINLSDKQVYPSVQSSVLVIF